MTCIYGEQDYTKVLTANHNKVLVVDSVNSKLITCGSLFQGTCEVRMLQNISIADEIRQNSAVTQPESFVAANSDEGTTVTFIAPGTDNQNVLYVGTSFTSFAPLRGNVPLIASRDLTSPPYNGLLDYAYHVDFADYGTYHKWATLSQSPAPRQIDYKAGFGLEGFSYFFTVDKVTSTNYESRLTSVCQTDKSYNSYMEFGLECQGSDGIIYNHIQSAAYVKVPANSPVQLSDRASYPYVIVGIFGKSADPNEKELESKSAVCIYDLYDVRQNVRDNLEMCFNGENNCKARTSVTATLEFCSEGIKESELMYVVGNQKLSAEAVYTNDSALLTSLTLDTVDTHIVALMGDSQGQLHKAVLSNKSSMREYKVERIVEDGGQDSAYTAILPDMPLDVNKDHLYIMTQKKVYRVPVERCESSGTTCDTCSKLEDPYCGWCSLERSCMRAASCEQAQFDKRWIPYMDATEWGCIKINSVSVSSTSRDKQKSIRLNIESLPQIQGEDPLLRYICVFGEDETAPETIGNASGSDLSCHTPETGMVPRIPSDQDHVTVTLGIKYSGTNVIFLNTDFSFYDCKHHKECSSCTESQWGCQWYIYDNQCLSADSQSSSQPQSGSVIENGVSMLCPRITQPMDQEILIPIGLERRIRLQAANLPVPPTSESGYECLLHSREPPLRIPATRIDANTVECQNSKLYFGTNEANRETKQESVAVVWQSNYYIEDPEGTAITLYSCAAMGGDCSKCISLGDRAETKKYQCRWCGNACNHNDQCDAAAPLTTNCPKPQITRVFPQKGPIGGGTLITIEGSNLGRKFSDVQDAVSVAGEKCLVIELEYKISERIVCNSSAVSSNRRGAIMVSLAMHESVVWRQEFSYEDPILRGLSPKRGPEAGGTLLTITGSSLDAAAQLSVVLVRTRSTNSQCAVSSVTASTIVCRTNHAEPSTVNKIRAIFDGNRKELMEEFIFTENPNITSIFPLQSSLSGGRQLTIKGTNLDSVQKPYMIVNAVTSDGERQRRRKRQTGGEIMTECTVQNAETMVCPTPYLVPGGEFPLTEPNAPQCTTPSRDTPKTTAYTLGFKMDAVPNLDNLKASRPDLDAELSIVPDPVYTVFTEVNLFKGGALELEGQNLNLAYTRQEVEVTIGKEKCDMKSLDNTRLYCNPPDEQPAPMDGGRGFPKVTVKVGNLCQVLGELEYVQIVDQPGSDVIFIAVGVTGGVLLFVIVVILACYKRKSKAAEQQYKAMQLQLDTLESNVRNECKQAFAELQTEVSDFTSDINVIGIPFWDYKTYTFKVLFPSLHDHSVLHTQVTYHTNQFGSLQYNSASKHGYDQGLHQFNQLLNSRQFILIFIRTLEQQKNFSIRDKAQVASLLMIVLQDKMDYATEILKALLSDLIDKSVEKKTSHPKLMLRRTESVVEKLLTNWLSICMYGYLKTHAGKSLFMLHKAIKHQTEKGVIDAITAEARYSLSEDRLLREKMDPKTLSVYLVTDENREPITCKVLDLDTITQAKEKALDAIYMNTPITRRPKVHDVDLVMLATFDKWRSGRSGHLPLQDEDVTTEVVQGWKKVNTLLHYHVPDGATMAIVPTRNKNEGVRNVNGMIELTSPSLNASTPIMAMEEGMKVWHVVKQDDNSHNSRDQKVISEIFLTRLLATKGTLQQYIDEMFLTILRVDSAVPPAIKYLFDFLDQEARRHGIIDPDVVHTWKSNSLPLRFWVNIIKNPEFVFDINKSHIVDSCLSVIAQTFMDACSTSEHRLGKDSPSNKLLFAKDIPKYRSWVGKFYRGIQDLPPVTEPAMQQAMTQLSMSHIADFNVTAALKDLYKYAQQYSFEFLENLDDDPSAKKLHLANKFEQVAAMIDGAPMY